MEVSFILFTIFSFIFLLFTKPSSANNCTSLIYDNLSPEIRSGFNLFCTQNKTIIRFPDYGDLVVKSISYHTKTLNLIDPKNCVHEVFLNLNLSSTPFTYYYALRQYKYINCSEKLTSFAEVPCLSSGFAYYHVYIVEPSFSVPSSCSCVKTVAIPYSYTPYLSDNSFGLGLTWDSTVRNDLEETNLGCLSASGVIAILILFLVGVLFYTKVSSYRRKMKKEKLKNNRFDEVEADKFQGEYEALSP